MSTPAVTPQQSDPFAEFGGSATGAAPATSATPAPASAQPSVPSAAQSDPFAEFGGVKVPAQDTKPDPSQTGEIVNDVGNKVIVPKNGESFADTMKRAVQYHNSLTPEQRQAAIDKETATMPKKTAQTLGAAATIGAVAGSTPAIAAVGSDVAGLAGEYAEYYGKQAGQLLKQIATEHPKAALAAKAYGTWLAGHVASKLGIPMPKIVKVLADL